MKSVHELSAVNGRSLRFKYSPTLAIASFWRPGSVDNADRRRSEAPSADAGSADRRKDWRQVAVCHRRQGGRAPSVVLAELDQLQQSR
jgi:hypothetical protein